MKNHTLLMVLLLTCLMVGVSQAESYAQWNMTGPFSGTGEMMANSASNSNSLIRINPGSTAFSKGLGDVVVCTKTGPADFLRVDINDLAANGGGDYVNAYTMVLDLRIDTPDWLPVYNTNDNNTNGAELWISPDGAIGVGAEYSAAGVFVPDVWTRLVIRRSDFSGQWQTELFVNGVFVIATSLNDGLDGYSSLYTNAQRDTGQFTILSDGYDPYGGCILGGFQFFSRAMPDEEIAGLGQYPRWVRAYDPQPAIGQMDVLTNAALHWKTATDPNNPNLINPAVTKHFVYFTSGSADDPNLTPVVTLDAGTTVFQPGPLNRDTTYQWRVDEGIGAGATPKSAGNIVGQVWHFTTVPSRPVIQSGTPADVKAFPGTAASTTVVAINPFTGDSTGLNYEWFRYVDGNNDISLGVNTPMLAVPSVEVLQEGQYYCIVTILSNGASNVSRLAMLTVKHEVGYWPMDGNANDASDPVDGSIQGLVKGSPTWVGGVKGQAIALNAATSVVDSVVLGTAANLNFGADTDFSVSIWIQSTSTAPWGTVISNKDWNDGVNVGWGLFDYSGPNMDWNIANGTGRADLYFPDLYDGKWHHVCATNSRGGLASVYIDGGLTTEQTIAVIPGTIDTGHAVTIGADGLGNYPFRGLVDEVKIFNYVLEPIDIARIYTGIVPGANVCIGKVEFDLNNDCRVTLEDFAMLAGAWMKCNLVPACIQ